MASSYSLTYFLNFFKPSFYTRSTTPVSKGVVLVTGANGYLGSHIVDQALKDGWTVRAVIRPGRSEAVKETFPDAGDKLQIVEVEDLVTSDLTEAVKGVDAIIHAASPNFGDTTESMLKSNIDGTLNIFKTGIAAGVKKLLYTSSTVTLFNADFVRAFQPEVVTEASWSEITRDQIDVANTGVFVGYMHSKTIAEKEFWKLADEHKDVDCASFLPTLILGARLPTQPKPASRLGFSTINLIYSLIDGSQTYPSNPALNHIHVKDMAKAHILALSIGPLPQNRRKRYIITAPEKTTWLEFSEIIRTARPELAEKTVPKDAELGPQLVAPYDTSLAAESLGLKEYIPLKETVLETVDWIVEWEKSQAGKA